MIKILKMLRPHVGFLIMSILFSTLATVSQLLLPIYTNNILSEGILANDLKGIWRNGFIMLAFTLGTVICAILNTFFSTMVSVNYAIDIRSDIFGRVSRLCQSDIDKIGVASLITRTTNDVNNVHDLILNTLKSLLPVPIMLIGGITMAVRYNRNLAATALKIIPILLIIGIALACIVVPIYNKIQKMRDSLNQILREKIGGIRIIRAFNRTDYEDSRFNQMNLALTTISVKVNRILAALLPFLTAAMYIFLCYLIKTCIVSADSISPDTLENQELIRSTIPNMYTFLSYFMIIISGVSSVVSIIVSIPQAQISSRRINEVIQAVSDVTETESPVTPREENRGEVEFRDVSFRYKPLPESRKKKKSKNKKTDSTEKLPVPEKSAKRPADYDNVSHVTFKSRPGEITAIIGTTGCGKSTLVNLIPRLYDSTEGEVLVAGVDVKDIALRELNDRIAFIPQQAYLFSGTIADNIRYGREDATEAEIWEALDIAQAKTFVSNMPDGINSFVSQAGKNFSGGQKQRLAIARAIVKRAEICIFDDSFSALDLATDSRLRAALRANLSDTNIIIVAQRVGTVLNADRIIVMDDGRVVGMGRHKELLEECETYREIVASQLSEQEDTAV